MSLSTRRHLIVGAAAAASALLPLPAHAGVAQNLVVYKSPSCGCCRAWTKLEASAGFRVENHDTDALEPVRRKAGIGPAMSGCRTAFVGGYVVGHVPPADVLRLLRERPSARGLAVPGMPLGAPGMEAAGRSDAYDTLLILRDGRTRVFARL